ncbi:PspA/IM30 family protein [Paucisalibacillus globulus]|uniref:PspA/IM30 family protein n=1 Tax=Paucisalibacillus globulus TaxID=351095 RepID=UPI001596DC07|nr:PspA/IM30 family protein [Paucisalibacillus globulus]
MSILTRVRTILASNINAKVENAKDPEEEMNQYIREMERDLREVKGETEAAIVLMNRAKRSLNDCLSEIDKMERYATRALENGDEVQARQFLEKKLSLKPQKQEYEKK